MSAADARPVLVTDSCCDLPPELVAEIGVVSLSFPYIMDGEEHLDDHGATMSNAEFYGRMRGGSISTTAAIPIPSYLETFRRYAAEGTPVVQLGLSSALSGTFEGVLTAREMVLEDYPEAVITVMDSLNASNAEGLLIHEAARRVAEGATHDEIVKWLYCARTRVNGYFTVDSLEYLRRGGRISDVAAMAGTVLDIKPILRLDAAGGLVVGDKVRGRRKSLRTLADTLATRIEDAPGQTIGIAHGDAPDDALALRALIEERVEVAGVIMSEVGPVIGSHTGPGMVSVVFWGRQRES